MPVISIYCLLNGDMVLKEVYMIPTYLSTFKIETFSDLLLGGYFCLNHDNMDVILELVVMLFSSFPP